MVMIVVSMAPSSTTVIFFNLNLVNKRTHEKEKERIVNEKRSFIVATSKFFISVTSLLLKDEKFEQKNVILFVRGLEDVVKKLGLLGFVKTNENEKDEEIASVAKDEIDPSVLWEQRKKDVEAERERHVITSPGFSFSTIGLLFPYHPMTQKILFVLH
ncbi:hypothetical protein SUGI_0829850 [Cryptomeria japonica]|nr:hypothetical protein SUGI_0829850 [Cryptomeria japonica]